MAETLLTALLVAYGFAVLDRLGLGSLIGWAGALLGMLLVLLMALLLSLVVALLLRPLVPTG